MFLAHSVNLLYVFICFYDAGLYLMLQNQTIKSSTSAGRGLAWLLIVRFLLAELFSDLNQTTAL